MTIATQQAKDFQRLRSSQIFKQRIELWAIPYHFMHFGQFSFEAQSVDKHITTRDRCIARDHFESRSLSRSIDTKQTETLRPEMKNESKALYKSNVRTDRIR